MSARAVELAVEVDAARLPLPQPALQALLEKTLDTCGLPGDVSLAVVDDAMMRRVNRDYHACDAATDVLAFPLGGPPGFAAEIVVSLDTAEREAAARGVEVVAEILLYVVHGALHLLGYDDHEPEAARKMHGRTLEILSGLGYQNAIEVDG